MAGSAAGGWVLPANQWVMLAAAAPMCLGIAATTSAGLALALVDRLALRYLGVAGLAALLLGLLGAVPLAWALGVGFSHVEADARAGGRLLLGLTFALAVLAAAGCAVLLDRAGPGPGAAAPEEHSADGVEPRG